AVPLGDTRLVESVSRLMPSLVNELPEIANTFGGPDLFHTYRFFESALRRRPQLDDDVGIAAVAAHAFEQSRDVKLTFARWSTLDDEPFVVRRPKETVVLDVHVHDVRTENVDYSIHAL